MYIWYVTGLFYRKRLRGGRDLCVSTAWNDPCVPVVWHDSSICNGSTGGRDSYVSTVWHDACVSGMWQDSFLRIYSEGDVTCAYLLRDKTPVYLLCDMTHPYATHSQRDVTHMYLRCDMTHVFGMWHDPSIRKEWFALLSGLNHKGAMCTRIAPLWISTLTGTARWLIWWSRVKSLWSSRTSQFVQKIGNQNQSIDPQGDVTHMHLLCDMTHEYLVYDMTHSYE